MLQVPEEGSPVVPAFPSTRPVPHGYPVPHGHPVPSSSPVSYVPHPVLPSQLCDPPAHDGPGWEATAVWV